MSLFEIFISCSNLIDTEITSKTDPMIKIFENDLKPEVYQSEVVMDDLNPVFEKTFIINSLTNEKRLRFEFFDSSLDQKKNTLLGSIKLTTTDIIKKFDKGEMIYIQQWTVEEQKYKNKNIGNLILRGINYNKISESLHINEITANGLYDPNVVSKIFPSLFFYRLTKNNEKLQLFKTESKRDIDVIWKESITLNINRLCDGDYQKEFLIECYEVGEKKNLKIFLGSAKLTMNLFKEKNPINFYLRVMIKNKDSEKGKIQIMNYEIKPKIIFEDYFKSKTQTIKLNFAIDFTGANGCVKNKDSLHFLGHDDNPYMVSISSIFEKILTIIEDRPIQMVGFGAKEDFTKRINQCFILDNFRSINNFRKKYKEILNNWELSGPSQFSTFLQYFFSQLTEKILLKDEKLNYFNFSIIFCEGTLFDFDNTLELIKNLINEPVFIIILVLKDAHPKKNKTISILKRQEELRKYEQILFIKFVDNHHDIGSEILELMSRKFMNYKEKIGNLP